MSQENQIPPFSGGQHPNSVQQPLTSRAAAQPYQQPPFEGQPQQLPSRKSKKAIVLTFVLTFLVGLLVFGVAGYIFALNQPQSLSVPEVKARASNQASSRNSFEKYLDLEKGGFNWKPEDFKTLKFNDNDAQNGSSPEEIIGKQGKAAELDLSDDNLDLTWYEIVYMEGEEDSKLLSSTQPQMRLSFYKDEEGNYHLERMSTNYLNFGNLAATEDESMPDQYFSQLQIGDSKTGTGGISYLTVLKEYGSPYGLDISRELSSEGGRVQMKIRYSRRDEGTYELSFIQQADGDYLLSGTERNS